LLQSAALFTIDQRLTEVTVARSAARVTVASSKACYSQPRRMDIWHGVYTIRDPPDHPNVSVGAPFTAGSHQAPTGRGAPLARGTASCAPRCAGRWVWGASQTGATRGCVRPFPIRARNPGHRVCGRSCAIIFLREALPNLACVREMCCCCVCGPMRHTVHPSGWRAWAHPAQVGCACGGRAELLRRARVSGVRVAHVHGTRAARDAD